VYQYYKKNIISKPEDSYFFTK